MGRKIDRWFPAKGVSRQSARERSFAVMTPLNKLHVWWARRPLAASRAAVLLSLVPEDADGDVLKRVLGLRSDDAWKFSPLREKRLKERLREWFREATGTEEPLVVDPMAGGGSIPFEALRLGCRVIAGELNPVAWLVLKATLEYPVEYGGELLEKMRGFFAEIRKELTERVGGFYPHTERFDNVWIKWVECPRCGLRVPTRPNWWLLRKRGKPEESLVILPDVPEEGEGNEVEFDVVKYPEVEGEFDPSEGTVNRGVVTCPRCGTTIRREQVHRLFRRHFEGEHGFVRAYLAAVVEGSGRGKEYRAATDRDLEFFERAQEGLFERWDELIAEDLIPTEEIPEGEKTREPRLRGIDSFYKLFNERQLLAHAELLRVIRELSGGLDDDYREPLTVYAMIAFDNVIRRNCVLTAWNVWRSAVDQIFRQHAYPWSWDHGEMGAVPGWWDFGAKGVLEAYEKIVKLLRGVEERPRVVLGDARELPALLDEEPDAIVVDPPYYDNVQYAELADFFHVWLKRSPVAEEFPEAFLEELTPKDEEVVANPARQEEPEREYEELLRESFGAMREVLSEDGRLTVMFTHREVGAWDTLVRALRDAGFRVNAAWPVHTESVWSLHQREKAAVRYTLILACEPREGGEEAWWSEVRREVRGFVREARERARELDLPPVDELVVAFGAALRAYTGYDRVIDEETGEEVEPEEVLDEARLALAEVVAEELEVGGLDEEAQFYAMYRYYFGYPSKSGSPDWDEVRRLCLALGLDPEGLPYLERYRGRAYLRTFEERDGVNPGRSTVDALHAALLALDEGREKVKEIVEKNDGVRGLARALAVVAHERYGDPKNYPRELRRVDSLLNVLGESVRGRSGQRRLIEF